uniref:Uncharacterized protein n=1 Tax=Nelumbo nucifera TaxID=4432 RepID=A0A822XZ44_NELNU|nr:TPA_asm: hypothetical protein HUJ06_026766 [Nelumbo nucifera]
MDEKIMKATREWKHEHKDENVRAWLMSEE